MKYTDDFTQRQVSEAALCPRRKNCNIALLALEQLESENSQLTKKQKNYNLALERLESENSQLTEERDYWRRHALRMEHALNMERMLKRRLRVSEQINRVKLT